MSALLAMRFWMVLNSAAGPPLSHCSASPCASASIAASTCTLRILVLDSHSTVISSAALAPNTSA